MTASTNTTTKAISPETEQKEKAQQQQRDNELALWRKQHYESAMNLRQRLGKTHMKFKKAHHPDAPADNKTLCTGFGGLKEPKLLEPGEHQLVDNEELKEVIFKIGKEGEESKILSPKDSDMSDEMYEKSYRALFNGMTQCGYSEVEIDANNLKRLTILFEAAAAEGLIPRLGSKATEMLYNTREGGLKDLYDQNLIKNASLVDQHKHRQKPTIKERNRFIKFQQTLQTRGEWQRKLDSTATQWIYAKSADELNSSKLADDYPAIAPVGGAAGVSSKEQYKQHVLFIPAAPDPAHPNPPPVPSPPADLAAKLGTELDEINHRLEHLKKGREHFTKTMNDTTHVYNVAVDAAEADKIQQQLQAPEGFFKSSFLDKAEVQDEKEKLRNPTIDPDATFKELHDNWEAQNFDLTSGKSTQVTRWHEAYTKELRDLEARSEALKLIDNATSTDTYLGTNPAYKGVKEKAAKLTTDLVAEKAAFDAANTQRQQLSTRIDQHQQYLTNQSTQIVP